MIETMCYLYGEQFSPKKMIEESIFAINIDEVIEPGQIGTYGRYKGIQSPFGACTIKIPDGVSNSQRIEWMTELISRQIGNFRRHGATDIVFHIEWRGLQGNMEFTPLELKKLAALQIPLSITYHNEVS